MKKIMRQTKTIAVVGMSKKPHRAGYYVPRYLQEAGYRIYAVNPNLKEPVLGEQPYAALSDLPEPVDLVLLFQRSENVPPFVTEAIANKAKAVWMQLGIRNDEAAAEAERAGLDVVQDACMMVEHRRQIS